MRKEHLSLMSLTTNDSGFSVIACPELQARVVSIVLKHINSIFDVSFCGSLEAAAEYCATDGFARIKEKTNRLLPLHLAAEFRCALAQSGFLSSLDSTREFITDEEGLGYENVYWRLVRPNHPNDVGPVHADYWFWELGHGSLSSSFARVKTWMPLLQSDEEPGLIVSPGSHLANFEFDSRVDLDGKRKPIPRSPDLWKICSPAPVRCGEAIVFHDRLLHGGRATSKVRLSLEWTTAYRFDFVQDKSNRAINAV